MPFPPVQRQILLNPGPATTTDTVKYAQVVPDICPREEAFGDLMRGLCRDLVAVAGGKPDAHAAVLFGGSGTAVMDAAISSCLPPGKKWGILDQGAYGRRMAEIAAAYGIPCEVWRLDPTRAPDLAWLDRTLRGDPDIACVGVVHHETTTGLLNPLEEVCRVVKGNGRQVLVDAISSLAGVPLDMAAWDIDYLLGTANKCLQGMPGASFVICRKASLEALRGFPRRSYYLDLHAQYEAFERTGQLRFTPPVQTLYALRRALDEFFEEGARRRHSRYAASSAVLRQGLRRLGLRLLLEDPVQSTLLVSVLEPATASFRFQDLHDRLQARGFTIYPGKLGDLPTFRLANIGSIDQEDIRAFLRHFEQVLSEMGVLAGESA